MKIWKKLTLLLSLSFAFSSLTACDMLFGGTEESSSSNSETSESGEPEPIKMTAKYDFAIAADVAETENGYDMKLGLKAEGLPEDEETKMVLSALNEIYYVDDFIYAQNPETKKWHKSSSTLGYLMAEEGQEVYAQAMTSVSQAIAELKSMEATDSTVTMSYAEEINRVLDYLAELNSETLLVDVIDDVLALEDTSFDQIVNKLVSYKLGEYTVAQVYAKAEEYVVNETEFESLQELKTALFADEAFYQAIQAEFGEEAAQTAKDFDISTVVTDYGTMTMDDVFAELVGDESATIEVFITMFAQELKQVTLGDIMGVGPGAGMGNIIMTPSSEIGYMAAATEPENAAVYYFEALSMIEVSKFDMVATLDANAGKLSSAKVEFDVAIQLDMGDMIMEYAVGLDMTLNLVNKVVAPTDVVTMCYNCDQETDLLYKDKVYLCEDCKARIDARYGTYGFVYKQVGDYSVTSNPENYLGTDRTVGSDWITVVLNEDGTGTVTDEVGTYAFTWTEDGTLESGDYYGSFYYDYVTTEDGEIQNVIVYVDCWKINEDMEEVYYRYIFQK